MDRRAVAMKASEAPARVERRSSSSSFNDVRAPCSMQADIAAAAPSPQVRPPFPSSERQGAAASSRRRRVEISAASSSAAPPRSESYGDMQRCDAPAAEALGRQPRRSTARRRRLSLRIHRCPPAPAAAADGSAPRRFCPHVCTELERATDRCPVRGRRGQRGVTRIDASRGLNKFRASRPRRLRSRLAPVRAIAEYGEMICGLTSRDGANRFAAPLSDCSRGCGPDTEKRATGSRTCCEPRRVTRWLHDRPPLASIVSCLRRSPQQIEESGGRGSAAPDHECKG
jgi:hypothetical protein